MFSLLYICYAELTNMKKFLSVFLVLSVVLGGCQSAGTNSGSDATVTHVVKKGEPKTMATLDINGMMCATACGGKIRKELEAIEGVTLATIDFEDERPLNHATVTYDPGKTSEQALIQTVNQIADGKLYHVESVEVVTYEKSSSESASNTADDDSDEVSFDVQRVFKFPDVFHLLDKLIR